MVNFGGTVYMAKKGTWKFLVGLIFLDLGGSCFWGVNFIGSYTILLYDFALWVCVLDFTIYES